ncbi:MAG TPA: hypothetical protein VFM64_00525 [Candidatus Nitrosotenuis sp.]|nr:hypothetical protein [Candidatus Nitrosotenuis sp.]
MSRWDNSNDGFDEEEESRLMKKFYDYAELEKKESERKRFLEISDKRRSSVWGNRFVISAIIQGAIITGLTVAMILMQIVSGVNLVEFLSLSMSDSAKWFFFGYFMYITLAVAIAITAIFYNHLESNLNKPIRGSTRYLVWAQLIGMNIGGSAVTILLIVFGFLGAGFVGFVSGEETQVKGIMEYAKIPVAGFALLFACGTASGIVAYLMTYLRQRGPKYNMASLKDEAAKFERL